MTQDLQHKTALVTGSGRGIGRAIALELARVGASIIVADRDADACLAVAAEIRASGNDVLVFPLDVTSNASIDRCIADAIRYFSRIDILVNNAGSFQSSLGFALDDAEFNRCLDVNLTGIWRMVRAIEPIFRAQNAGRIINIASVGGRQGVDFAPAYCASKAGVINLTQSLAAALGANNINVNTVCPGSISTTMQDEIKALRGSSGHPATLPLSGPLTAQDIGHAVVFLASDYAESITGQALNVDCGEFMN